MTAYLTRMPAGIPGAVSRQGSGTTIEQNIIYTVTPPTLYGVPLAIDPTTGQVRAIKAADTAASVYGILVRPFPSNSSQSGIGASVPPISGICDVCKRGYMNVQVNGATVPAKNGAVYVRTIVGTGAIIGGIEALADGVNTFVMTGAYFTGVSDATGIGEIAFNL